MALLGDDLSAMHDHCGDSITAAISRSETGYPHVVSVALHLPNTAVQLPCLV
jgi:hypothetical protein